MYRSILIICFILTFNIVTAQKTSLSEFQRFGFGMTRKALYQDNNEKIDEYTTKAYSSYGHGFTALAYYTRLVGIQAKVRYSFYQDFMDRIDFSSQCHGNNGVYINSGQSNNCTSQTLKEFFAIKKELDELFDEKKRCLNCEICYTKYIQIPTEYSLSFENELIQIAKNYPENFTICSSWLNYTNNSTVKLTFSIDSGWNLSIEKNK